MNKTKVAGRQGLRFKLIYRLFAAVVVISFILILSMYGKMKRDIQSAHAERLVSMAQNIAANSEFGFITGDEQILLGQLEGAKRQKDVLYAAIVETGNGGDIILAKHGHPAFHPPAGKKIGFGAVVTYNDREHGLIGNVIVPVKISERSVSEEGLFTEEGGLRQAVEKGTNEGYVQLCFSMEREVHDLRVLMIWTFFSVVAAFLLLWIYYYRLLTGEVIKPLGEFIKGTEEVAKGRLDVRVNVNSTTEIGELAEAFNNAVEKRQAAEKEVARHREHLEELIAERTNQLAESEKRFKQLSEAAHEGIIVHSGGIALDANKQLAEMHGYGLSEIIGKNAIDILVHPDDRGVVKEKSQTQSEETYEVRHIKKDGSVIYVETRGRKIQYKGKEARVTIIRDISERKKTLDALREAKENAENANKMKDQFVSLVSHDLKSPLSSIKTMLDMVDRSSMNLDDIRKEGILRRMTETSGRLLNMIDQLLSHSRLKSGKIIPRKMVLFVKQIADKHIQGITDSALQKGVVIGNELPEQMCVFADPALFGQVLQNLLSNAVKFTPRGGNIAVFAPRPGEPVIAVKNSGAGVPEEIKNDVFNGDIQTSTIGTAGEKGSGLGLPYAHDIMRAHGGALVFESNKDGNTVFTATLPAKRRIALIVDDQEMHRATMMEYIGKAGGMEVLEAANGLEAVEALRLVTPSVIITDIQMPEMDGYALIGYIRQKSETKDLPVLAVTAGTPGMEMDTLQRNIINAGASAFLSKPFTEDEFIDALRRLIPRDNLE